MCETPICKVLSGVPPLIIMIMAALFSAPYITKYWSLSAKYDYLVYGGGENVITDLKFD